MSGDPTPRIVPSAVTFTPFGLYLDVQPRRLVPWAQVRQIIEAEDGEIVRLLGEPTLDDST